MNEYHKIPTVFKRDPATNHRTLLLGEFATPELKYLQDASWAFTEKVDGTNIRVMWSPETGLTFGGKTDNAQIPTHLMNRLNEMFADRTVALEGMFDSPACLYGEGYGAKIQKGGSNYSNTQEFVLFDVKIGDWWLERSNVEDVAKKLGLQCVPIYGEGTLHDMVRLVKGGIASAWGDFLSEGLVSRPTVSLSDRGGNRIITKLKTKDFRSQ